MRWAETCIPRHMATPPVVAGGVLDRCEWLTLIYWPDDYATIAVSQQAVTDAGSEHDLEATWAMLLTPSMFYKIRRRPQPKRMPAWQIVLVLMWLGIMWVWKSLSPEAER